MAGISTAIGNITEKLEVRGLTPGTELESGVFKTM